MTDVSQMIAYNLNDAWRNLVVHQLMMWIAHSLLHHLHRSFRHLQCAPFKKQGNVIHQMKHMHVIIMIVFIFL